MLDPELIPAKAGTNGSSPHGRRWGEKGRSDPVARAASATLGLSERYIEHLIRAKNGLNIRCAELIKAYRALGDDVRLERFFAPIRAAYENKNPQVLSAELVQSEQEADCAEDVAELRYWQTRTDKDLSLAIRAMDTAIVRQIAVRDAMAIEEQRRMQQS
jgi:hypothetical protein